MSVNLVLFGCVLVGYKLLQDWSLFGFVFIADAGIGNADFLSDVVV